MGATRFAFDLLICSKIAFAHRTPQAFATPVTQVFDLGTHDLTTEALDDLIVPLGQRLKGGIYGKARVVLMTRNTTVA